MMIPPLHPEIYRLIAQHVKRPTPIHSGPVQYLERVELEQKDLSNLVKSSKVRMTTFLLFLSDR